jgi:AmmeMemoRadiSam system protein A
VSNEPPLQEAEGKELLKLARRVIESEVHGGPEPEPDLSAFPGLEKPLGVFVTLHKSGSLRGCIGSFLPEKPVWRVVSEMARASAFQDPRFPPVGKAELDDIDIEISVLSPLEKTDDPLSLEPGVHGVYVKRGVQSGTFLPQVATEFGMSREEFLSQCCAHKAGLPPDAWKDPETEVYLYTAQIFEEEER